jgi:hypothetical protein
MDDGETLSIDSTSGLLEFISAALDLPALETAKKLSTNDRFQQLDAETAEIRRLVVAVTEQLSAHQTVTNQMFARQSELVDAGINRGREHQLEIRGLRLRISSASEADERHRDHQQQVHVFLQQLLPTLQFKVKYRLYGVF